MAKLSSTLLRLRVADFEGLPSGLVAALGCLTSLRLLELVDLRGEGAGDRGAGLQRHSCARCGLAGNVLRQ